MTTKFRRINELRGLVENPGSSDAYFHNFNQTVREWPQKKREFLDRERELQGLGPIAWAYLKEELRPLLHRKHSIRGWRELFDIINHAKAYNYLARLGCTRIEFIPRISGERTPDLKAVLGTTNVLCEVKTIDESDLEMQRRTECGVGRPKATLPDGFFRKLISDLDDAKNQMDRYAGDSHARKIAYIIVNVDERE